jgi:hypothetical protein
MSADRELEQRVRSAVARVAVSDRPLQASPRRGAVPQLLTGVGVIALLIVVVGLGQLVAGFRAGPAASTPDPNLAALPSTITSAQAIAEVRGLGERVGRIDRIDAKLMSLEEFLAIAGPLHMLPADPRGPVPSGVVGVSGDPASRYVWVVAMSGEVWPQPRSPVNWGEPRNATPNPNPTPTPYPPYRWGLFLIEANRGTLLTMGGAGIAESWPTAFDWLPSHPIAASPSR